MKASNFKRQILFALAVVAFLSATFISGARAFNDSANSSVVRFAPPAPVFDESTRFTELASRRSRVAQTVGDKGMLILFSTEPRVYTNDVDYEYRQENNLYYLTNLKQKGADRKSVV